MLCRGLCVCPCHTFEQLCLPVCLSISALLYSPLQLFKFVSDLFLSVCLLSVFLRTLLYVFVPLPLFSILLYSIWLSASFSPLFLPFWQLNNLQTYVSLSLCLPRLLIPLIFCSFLLPSWIHSLFFFCFTFFIPPTISSPYFSVSLFPSHSVDPKHKN